MQSPLEEEEKCHRELLNIAEANQQARERVAEYKWFKSALRGKINAFHVDGGNFIDLARYLEDSNSTYARIITNETRRCKSLKMSLAV